MARALRRLVVAVVFGLHAWLAVSILAQPVSNGVIPAHRRSALWPLFNDSVHRPGPGADLLSVYHAGVALAAGAGPYATRESPLRTPYYFPFRYLPVVAQTLGRGLSTLGPQAAFRLWGATVEGLLLLFSFVYLRRLDSAARRDFALCALLLSTPYFLELHMGQFTFAALALVAVGLLVQEEPRGRLRGRWSSLLGALAYTCGVLLKVFPTAALPAFLRERRYVWNAAVAVPVVVLVSLPWFASHPRAWQTFTAANFHAPRAGLDAGNFSALYAAHLFLGDAGPPVGTAGFAALRELWRALALGGTALLVLVGRRSSALLGATALLLAHFVSYIHVWEHHMSAVLLLGLLLLRCIDREADPSWRRAATAICAGSIVLLALPTPFAILDAAKDPRVWDPSASWPTSWSLALAASKAVPTLALYACSLALLGRAKTRSAATAPS